MIENELFLTTINLISNPIIVTNGAELIVANDNILVSLIDKNKIPKVFEITISILKNYPNHYIVVFTDITAVQKEKELLEKLAYIDPLTNIFNRQMFNNELLHKKEIV